MEKVYKANKDRGFVLLAINIMEDKDTVLDRVEIEGFTFPVLLDSSGAVTQSYQVTATPTVYVVNRKGQAVGRVVGSRPWESEKGQAFLNSLLSEPAR
jgi:thioredoxin-related protein